MSSTRSFTRRNKSKTNVAEAPLSPQSQQTLRRFSIGVIVVMVLFVAGLSWAFSSTPDDKSANLQQVASATNAESVDPLAHLNRHVIPGQQSAVASLATQESFSESNTNLMLAGFGGGGQNPQSTTVDYIYDGQNMVRTLKNGGPGATYLNGPSGPVYRRDDSIGQVRWYLPDGLGNIVGEVDPMGNITSNRKFDAFGNIRGGNNPGGTSKHKFQGGMGHLSEDETGLVYMRARYMDPTTGRFISEDPAFHGKNWFAYAGNNPVNRSDFTGREDLPSLTVGMDGAFIAEGVGGVEPITGMLEIEGSGGLVDINTIQTTGQGAFRLRDFMGLLKNWGSENGLRGLIIRAQTVSSDGEKLAKVMQSVVNHMGDQGLLTRDGDLAQLYWLFQ